MAHLWEVDHAYYCNEGNYYAPGREQPYAAYKTWAAFEAAEADADLDYNLVFRWDWKEGEDWGAGEFTGDPYYRNGKLLIFFMGQRKGLYRWAEIAVCRADEAAVIRYLDPRFRYLMNLWAPFTASAIEARQGGDGEAGSVEDESAVAKPDARKEPS